IIEPQSDRATKKKFVRPVIERYGLAHGVLFVMCLAAPIFLLQTPLGSTSPLIMASKSKVFDDATALPFYGANSTSASADSIQCRQLYVCPTSKQNSDNVLSFIRDVVSSHVFAPSSAASIVSDLLQTHNNEGHRGVTLGDSRPYAVLLIKVRKPGAKHKALEIPLELTRYESEPVPLLLALVKQVQIALLNEAKT
ncbi:hypothetical protein F4604DRAFT_1994521, partial [Suillus subluteus]